MAKLNYRQAKRQKETNRKARQEQKLAKKQARIGPATEGAPDDAPEGVVDGAPTEVTSTDTGVGS